MTFYGHAKVAIFDDNYNIPTSDSCKLEHSSNFLIVFSLYIISIELCVSFLTLKIDTETKLMSMYGCVM